MIEQKSGKIVNITSGRGIAGAMGGAAYSASKAGIIGFTKSLAFEVAPYKINVNAVAPGQIDTEMSRGGKSAEEIKGIEEKSANPYLPNGVGKPDDVVGTVIFLSSEACRFITGQVIFMRGP